MIFLVLTTLSLVYSSQLANLDDKIRVIKRFVNYSSPFILQRNQFFEITDFNGLGRSIDINLTQLNPLLPNICWAFQSSIRIHNSGNPFKLLDDKKFQDLDTLSIEELSNAAGEKLTQMVHLKKGALVMSNSRLFLFQFNREGKLKQYTATLVDQRNISQFQANEDFLDDPQLVYDNTTDHAYLIYYATTLKFKVTSTKISDTFIKVESWISRNDIQFVRISNSILYSSSGSNGVDIYQINRKGNLKFLYNLNATSIYPDTPDIDIDVVDIAIGGKDDQYLYILDQENGITQFKLTFGQDEDYSIDLNQEFGQISITGASAFEVYNQTMIIVIQQRVSSMAIEYYLQNHQNWFQVNTHIIKGRIRDVDITKNFAILTGMNTHRIIQHSIYQGFQNFAQKRNEEMVYLFTGGLKELDFFTTANGEDKVIFGITGHSLVLFQWTEETPSISCFPYINELSGVDLSYTATYNTTKCAEKTLLLEKQSNLIEPLVVCQTTEQFLIRVIQPLVTDRQRNVITIVLSGVLFLILFITFGLACMYRRYSLQKERFEQEIKDIERRGKQSKVQKGQILVEEKDQNKNQG